MRAGSALSVPGSAVEPPEETEETEASGAAVLHRGARGGRSPAGGPPRLGGSDRRGRRRRLGGGLLGDRRGQFAGHLGLQLLELLLGAVGMAEGCRRAALIGQVWPTAAVAGWPGRYEGCPGPIRSPSTAVVIDPGGHVRILAGLLNLLLVTGEQRRLRPRGT